MTAIEIQLSNIDRAKTACSEEDLLKAEQILRQVLEASDGVLFSEIESNILRAEAHSILGKIAYRRSKYTLALEHYNLCLHSSTITDDKSMSARSLRNIGDAYQNLTDYEVAKDYQYRALALDEEIQDLEGISLDLGSLGNLYFYQSDYRQALDYYLRALSIAESLGNNYNAALYIGNIANVYNCLSDYGKSLEYYNQAIILEEKNENTEGIARLLGNIGALYQALDDSPRAIDHYEQALLLCEKINDKRGVARNTGSLGLVYQGLGDNKKSLQYQLEALKISEEIGDLRFVGFWLAGIAMVETSLGNYDSAELRLLKTLAVRRNELKSNEEVAETLLQLGNLLRIQGRNDQVSSILNEAMALAVSMDQQVTVARIHEELAAYFAQIGDGISAYEHYKLYHNLEKEVLNQSIRKQADKFDLERKQAEREKQLAIERARSKATDEILSNILPPTITDRLLKGEKKIADTHENVSVLFADIVGFTQLSSQLPAGELIDILDMIFTRFDMICKKHGLEKIKTIGDAYMAVCGAPIAVENHAERTALVAIEMLENFSSDQRISVPEDLEFRIGLHSGSVVAGIIGENKYSYDLWGDAVNTASRMESHGEPGKIHVSEEFRNALISTTFDEQTIQFIPRGEMDIKGKGMMKTYFLERST